MPPNTIIEHAVWILGIAGRFLERRELIARLLEAGCARNAKNPEGSIGTVLSDELKKSTSRLVKREAAYGLPSWKQSSPKDS
ncbi:MAG: hypothetical protein OXT71_16445 [Acidobacteriota bacterium]|nr:hypothetical protein [Acidobacteriota bacterium]